jgi:hypothetical protein
MPPQPGVPSGRIPIVGAPLASDAPTLLQSATAARAPVVVAFSGVPGSAASGGVWLA